MSKTEDKELSKDGIVIYTDAGAKPNPGYAGWGIHGYVYNIGPAKKGFGNHTSYITSEGYVPKQGSSVKLDEIIPIKFIDGVGGIPRCSNNAGEVTAMAEGLRHAAMSGVKKAILYSDSMYAINGATKYIDAWKNNNWKKSDGASLPNMSEWQNLDKSLKLLKEAGVDLDIRWVKGHSDNEGNIIVDSYATAGVSSSRHDVHKACITTSDAKDYWAKDEHHPFLSSKCVYMTSNPLSNQEGEYFLGDHGKKDELMGRQDADTAYAYVVLKEPNYILELIRKYILAMASNTDHICLINLSVAFSQAFKKMLDVMAEFAFIRVGHRFDIQTVKKEPIVTELYPPKISIRAVEAVNTLKGIYLDWKTNPNTELIITDITDRFYKKDAKGKNILLPEINSGYEQLNIIASYDKENKDKTIGVDLTLGVDTPKRNTLKKIEALDPKMILVLWRESGSIRYATICTTTDAESIWAGYYANIKIVA